MLYERPSIGAITFARNAGPDASLGEIFDAAVESARYVDNVNARVRGEQEAYDRRIDAIKEATGVQLFNPRYRPPDRRRNVKDHIDWDDDFQRELERLAEQFPQHRDIIAPHRPVQEEVKANARAIEGRLLDVLDRSRGVILPYATMFAGGMRGALEDPANIGTMFVGPAGGAGRGATGLLWMAVRQGAANAGVEAALQPVVQNWRREAGMDYGARHAALNIATAFALGGAFDAGVRGTFRGVQHARGLEPETDDAGVIRGWKRPEDALEASASELPPDSVIAKARSGDRQALDELTEATGVADDPVVRGAKLADDLEADLEERVPGVDDGEGLRKLAHALRHADDPDTPPPLRAEVTPVARQPSLADDVPSPGRKFQIENKAVSFREVDPVSITTDAAVFQFKRGGDAAGATDRLSGVQEWDPIAAGRAVIYERADGTQVIVDGHQRLALAKRLNDPDTRLQAFVFREADGWTPGDVRALAAKKNLQEGSGSVVDAASIIRERPDIIDTSVPLGSNAMRQARALSRLSNEAFAQVVAGIVSPNYAALIGDLIPDKSRHAGMMADLVDAAPANVREARIVVQDLMQLPVHAEEQMTLLGAHRINRSVMRERAKVLDTALQQLKSDQRIFALLQREADRIEGAGNKLAGDVNAARTLKSETVSAVIEQLALTRGPVSDWLNEAANGVAGGRAIKDASAAFVWRVALALDEGGIKALQAETPSLRGAGIDDVSGDAGRTQTADLEGTLKREIDDARDPDAVAKRQDDVDAQLFSLREHLQAPKYERLAEFNNAIPITSMRPWTKSPDNARILAFHGTSKDFNTFDKSKSLDFGVHFGTPGQANTIVKKEWRPGFRALSSEPLENARVLPVVIEVNKAVTLPDLRYWEPNDILKELEKLKIKVSQKTKSRVVQLAKEGKKQDANTAVEQVLMSAGFDAIRYQNMGEGFGWSYIVWEPGKVRSATTDATLFSLPERKHVIDSLGYYSKALEAAKKIKQEKGTPEQILAQLKTAGVKDAEIEAAGLNEFFEGNKAITRAAIVGHLENSRIELNKTIYGSQSDADGVAQFSNYSLDPSNPTYREAVVHLPAIGRSMDDVISDIVEVTAEYDGLKERMGPFLEEATPENLADADRLNAKKAALHSEMRGIGQSNFTASHFPEPNVVAHLRTSIQKDASGRNVLVLNELQSDWGQELRKIGGPKSERAKKIVALEREIEALEASLSSIKIKELGKITTDANVTETVENLVKDEVFKISHRPRRLFQRRDVAYANDDLEAAELYSTDYDVRPEILLSEENRKLASKFTKLTSLLDALDIVNKRDLRVAELHRMKSDNVPSNPLVNTTDQWISTSLRQAIRHAVELDVDRIAIASGETVDSFDMGAPVDGLKYAYNEMYPKKLRKMLSKIDKNSAVPERVKTLKSHDGARDLGKGFTVFPITDQVRRVVIEEGLPLFSVTDPKSYRVQPDAAANMAAIRKDIDAVAARLPEGVSMTVQDRLTYGNVGEIDGRYDKYDGAIYVSLRSADPRRVARHEEVHVLRDLGLFSDREWQQLTDYANKFNLRKTYDVDGRYAEIYKKQFGDEAEARLVEETIADMIADYNTGTRFGGVIDRIVERIVDFLRQVRDALGLQGFRSVHDVFDSIERGDLGSPFSGRRKVPLGELPYQRLGDLAPDVPATFLAFHGTTKPIARLRGRHDTGLVWFATEPALSNEFALSNDGSNLMPVIIENARLYHGGVHGDELARRLGVTDEYEIDGLKYGEYLDFEDPRIINEIKKMGFDGVVMLEKYEAGNAVKSVAMFGNKKVKSATTGETMFSLDIGAAEMRAEHASLIEACKA